MGLGALGNKLAPTPEQQGVNNRNANDQASLAEQQRQSQASLAEQQRQFNLLQQMSLQKMGNSNFIRQSMMPGLYTNLGMSPEKAQNMTAQYTTKSTPAPSLTSGVSTTPSPGLGAAPAGGSSYGYTPGAAMQPKTPGLGATAGKAALGVGLGLAPGLISGASAGIGAGTMTGMAGAIGATGMATLGIGAAAALGALMWKKSQVHPTANTWVQGEQNPFDKSMAAIDKAGLPPDQVQQAKTQNAQTYLSELMNFSRKGSHEAIVAKQAADTFRQWYGDPGKYGVQLPF